jgi:hypothetical protein
MAHRKQRPMAKTTARRPTPHPLARSGMPGDAEHTPPMPPLAQTRVGKSLHPGRAGTLKLLRRFGPPLLLVRYRYDWTGLYRYITVELLVDAEPVTRGNSPKALHAVRVERHEHRLKAAVRALGGQWEPQLLRWILPGAGIQQLNLSHRVEWVQDMRQTGRERSRRRSRNGQG